MFLDVNPSLIDISDFDCVLCYRTLWKPVVTPCGHTYCMVRALNHHETNDKHSLTFCLLSSICFNRFVSIDVSITHHVAHCASHRWWMKNRRWIRPISCAAARHQRTPTAIIRRFRRPRSRWRDSLKSRWSALFRQRTKNDKYRRSRTNHRCRCSFARQRIRMCHVRCTCTSHDIA